MHIHFYTIFYSQYSHQHVSAGIAVILRVMLLLLLQKYNCIDVVSCVAYWLEQFQPVCHTVYTSPKQSSKQYTTPSTHHLQTVPISIPHRPHITYKQFQPVYHTVHTSPTTSSNRYTTPSTHHLQPVPTVIPHRPHITYKQFQPVYHTVHTSPTNSYNRYTTPSTHHLQTVPISIPHRPHITYNLLTYSYIRHEYTYQFTISL